MRDLARFLVWVEMEAHASEFWSESDEDGNDAPRHRAFDLCEHTKAENRVGQFLDALQDGRFRMEWP